MEALTISNRLAQPTLRVLPSVKTAAIEEVKGFGREDDTSARLLIVKGGLIIVFGDGIFIKIQRNINGSIVHTSGTDSNETFPLHHLVTNSASSAKISCIEA